MSVHPEFKMKSALVLASENLIFMLVVFFSIQLEQKNLEYIKSVNLDFLLDLYK